MLSALPRGGRPARVLVGPESWDDAGVIRLSPTRAMAQTVDFITPVVNDPYDFGRIAGANALSDIYAMGGVPRTALSIVCYPEAGDMGVLRDILRGGVATLRRAGVALLGGHSVRDPEIKFGFAVTGDVHPKRIVTNAGARPGDVLVLTKPLGIGILATALKRRLLGETALRRITAQMAALNEPAARAMRAVGVDAATDVSGFGLLGHALNIARASRVAIRLWSGAVPVIPEALAFAGQGVAPAGLRSNRAYAAPRATFDDAVPEPLRMALADPQTSGGLLIAVPPSRVDALVRRLRKARVRAAVVGDVLPRGKPEIRITA